jgi:hypothetical protein
VEARFGGGVDRFSGGCMLVRSVDVIVCVRCIRLFEEKLASAYKVGFYGFYRINVYGHVDR